ncbi:MAG: hypothetical protein U5L96_19310 [Owenweeksia sp.]|nr:hypothetical protein [Owenweeksia sp.]
MANLPGKYLLIRGLAAKEPPLASTANLKVIPFADAVELATYIRSSSLVVSRSGYSSIMDYYFFKKQGPAYPYPRPARAGVPGAIMASGGIDDVSQERMVLADDLKKAMKYPGLQQEMMGAENWEGLFFTLFEGKR